MTQQQGPQILSVNACGPLPPSTLGLIIGRGSLIHQGLRILPGTIDADFSGQINVVAISESPLLVVEPHTCVAQLLLIPLTDSLHAPHSTEEAPLERPSHVFFSQQIKTQKGTMQLTLNDKEFTGLIDTGADVTIVTKRDWPSAWPVVPSITHLQGIGQSQNPMISSIPLAWKTKEGKTGSVQPYVLPGLPLNLWGRDILSQMDLILIDTKGLDMLIKQGYVPGQCLGKDQQGIIEPILPVPKNDRLGLGNFP